MAAFALIVISGGVGSGVLYEFDFGRLMGPIGAGMEFVAGLLRQLGVLS